MKTQLSGDEGRVGEWAWSQPAVMGVMGVMCVGGWNPSSGCRRFPVFWQEGMDLVCGKAAVGEFLQAVAEIEADVEIGALGAGEHGHDGGDGWAAFLGAQMHPILTAEGDRAHAVLTRSARPAGSLSAVHLRCAPVDSLRSPCGQPLGCPSALRSGSHQLLSISTTPSVAKTQKRFH